MTLVACRRLSPAYRRQVSGFVRGLLVGLIGSLSATSKKSFRFNGLMWFRGRLSGLSARYKLHGPKKSNKINACRLSGLSPLRGAAWADKPDRPACPECRVGGAETPSEIRLPYLTGGV